MQLISEYIKAHSDGSKQPVCGRKIASAFNISGVEVRKLINTARSSGDPICANGKGYYITRDTDEIQQTIDSIRSRIAGMNNAISGLEQYLRGDVCA